MNLKNLRFQWELNFKKEKNEGKNKNVRRDNRAEKKKM